MVDEKSKESLIVAAKNWANDNKDKLPADKGGVSINILEKEGYVSENNNKGCVLIADKNGAYYYSYSESTECREYTLVDNTPPVIEAVITSSTTNSIKVDVSAKDNESLISMYKFQIDNNSPVSLSVKDGACAEESCSYTFNKLIDNTNHTIKVSVINSLDKEANEIKDENTKLLQTPSLLQNSRYGQINYQN